MQNLPNDPVMLLSFTNTQLRDNFSNIDKFCKAYSIEKSLLLDKLGAIDYRYNRELNKFI